MKALVFTLWLTLSSLSHSSTTCLESIRALNRDVLGELLGPEDRRQIDALFQKQTLSPSERGQALFQIVLEARLRKLAPHQASEIRRISNEATRVRASLTNSVDGVFWRNGNKRGIDIRIPNALRETYFEYMLRLHELEHAIQQLHAPWASPFQDAIRNSSYYIERRFESEIGAMAMEFHYISSLPLAERERLAKLVNGVRWMSPRTRRLLKDILLGSDKPLREYVDMQHELGRYSLSQIQKFVRIEKLTVRSLQAFGTYVALRYVVYPLLRGLFEACQDAGDEQEWKRSGVETACRKLVGPPQKET